MTDVVTDGVDDNVGVAEVLGVEDGLEVSVVDAVRD